jgi:DNA-binding SARP family transcriptional activator/tetratricopeptide (TPR) repeat protein
VRRGGRTVRIDAPKQRALLALLLLRANEVVSSDRLAEELWAGEPPPSARKLLTVYVSQLRKALVPAGEKGEASEVLLTRPGGYLLAPAPDGLDLHRFLALVEEARRTRERDSAGAAEALRRALALWRGPPLAEFAYEPFAQAELGRLEELRLATLEERFDVELALGLHGALVPELQALVAEHPLRERLHGQLMLALYRSGRQAESLEVYRRLREVLVDELGIEPTAAIRELERSILAQDAALDLAAQPRPAGSEIEEAVPQRELPAGPTRELKLVTVLFCTSVQAAGPEIEDPEDAHERAASHHRLVRGALERFGGTVQPPIGDAVMAVFGAPVAHEDDAERAVRAGLRVLESLGEHGERVQGPAAFARVGVSTGPAVVSPTASAERGEALVGGEVVNAAARIHAAAPPGCVAVGERTFRATERVFEYEPLASAAARDGAQPTEVWQAVAARARPGADVIRSPETPLVGRELDLALLRSVFDKVAGEGAVQLVTIVGEPGVGKSRLVGELYRELDDRPGFVTWRQGRCLPYGEGITFWALGEILKTHAGIYESDAPEAATEKLEAVLPESEERPWLCARLLPLLGIESEPATQQEAFTAWRRFLESLAETRPAVLLFEDVHCADDALLDFVEHLADWAQGVPLLIVCTARPELYETHSAWGTGLGNHTTIRLSPLSAADTSRLVSVLLDPDTLPPDTKRLLLDRAGGNPLYAEEFVRMLRDRALLDRRGSLEGDANAQVPDSLHTLIAARLDTLPLERKRLLQDAAVMGQVFWAGSLTAMDARDPEDVRQALHELARTELIRPARRSSMKGEAEYAFWHLLVRDVAYGQIPRGQRAAKHVSAARWLEAEAGKRIEDLAEVLAYHTGEALRLARAADDDALAAELAPVASRYAMLAGERALGLDTGKALTLLERARRLTPEDAPGYPLVQLRWADAARQAGRHREAAAALEEAIAGLQDEGDVLHAGEALATLSNVRRYLGEPGHAASAEQAVALLEHRPGPELVAALAQLAGFNYSGGAYDQAIATAGRALDLARRLGLPAPARALGFRGGARCAKGETEGLGEMEQALELLVEQGKGRDAAVLHGNLAVVRWLLAGPAAALAQFEQAETFADLRGLTELSQSIAAIGVSALVELGRLGEALALAEALAPALRESGNLIILCDLRAYQARALAEQGRTAESEIGEALRIARDSEVPYQLTVAAAAASPGLVAAGRAAAARALLSETAGADNHDTQDYAFQLPALARAAFLTGDAHLVARLADHVPETLPLQRHGLVTARALQAELDGDTDQAATLHAEAAGRWEEFGCVLEQAHALLGQGRCLTRLASPVAVQPLRRAHVLFATMDARARVADCDSLLAEPAVPGRRPGTTL